MATQRNLVTVLIPIPVEYNADSRGRRKPVEYDKFIETGEELALAFGGGMLHYPIKGKLTGFWADRGFIDRDDLVVFEVDIPDTPKSREKLKDYVRTKLLPRFEQKAIYVRIIGPIETMLISEQEIADN